MRQHSSDLQKDINLNHLASIIHKKYSQLPGSGEIASLLALEGIVETIEKLKECRIIEIGGGIGTITELCLSLSNVSSIATYEDNQFCIEKLRILESLFDNKLILFHDWSDISNSLGEILIIDYLIPFNVLKLLLKNNLNILKHVIIEGNRYKTRIQVCIILLINFCSFNIATILNKKNDKEALFILNIKKCSFLSWVLSIMFFLKLIPRYLRLQIRYFLAKHKNITNAYTYLKRSASRLHRN